jgi:hypothetical protein
MAAENQSKIENTVSEACIHRGILINIFPKFMDILCQKAYIGMIDKIQTINHVRIYV